MAAIPTEFRGTLFDLQSKSSREVFLTGVSYRSDMEVGGGPVYPPGGSGGGGQPSHPIWGPPGSNFPGGPGSGYPPVAGHPLPPIEGPPDGGQPPVDSGSDKPPPANAAGWGWVSEWGRWGFFPQPGVDPTPKG